MKVFANILLFTLVIAAALAPAIVFQEKAGQIEPPARVTMTAQEAVRHLAALPVRFEPTPAVAGREPAFLGRGFGYTIFLTPGGATVSPEKNTAKPFSMQLVGSNPLAQGGGAGQAAGVSNYLLGSDRSAWRTEVPNYSAVRYTSVYPGVDLLYYGKQQELEYDFIVAPGTRPQVIGLRFDGARSMELTSAGDLQLRGDQREALLRKPIAYQESDGARTEIACRFALRESGQVGFELGDYDASLPLIIDPVLSYSTFIGGSLDEQATAVALDGSGNIYVTGFTDSSNFPNAGGGAQQQSGGAADVFVIKLNSSGTAAVYATYVGGAADDKGFGIAVDGSGNAHITGATLSDNFPSAQGGTRGGSSDAFVVRLNSSGSAISFSRYLGGTVRDAGQAIAVNSAGEIFVVGYTTSSDFPRANALQNSFGGGTQNGTGDGFATKMSSSGSLIYSTYIGGSADDGAFDAAIDSGGSLFIAGSTSSSSGFPIANAFRSNYGGGVRDAFVAKLNSTGSVAYSTYLGGGGDDGAEGIAIDGSGSAVVTGFTNSQNFPTAGAMQGSFGGGAGLGDAFVTKLSVSGNAAVYSTYLGGSGEDFGSDVALDSSDRAIIVGGTASANFPMLSPSQPLLGGGSGDAFVAMLAASGSSLVYSTFLGASANDVAWAVTSNSSGTAYVVGQTASGNFTTVAAVQASIGGAFDGFVARVEPTGGGGAVPFSVSVTPNSMTVNRGQAAAYNVSVTSNGGAFNSAVNLGCGNLPTGTRCTFNPASVTPGAAGATAALSISTTAAAGIPPVQPLGPQSPQPMLWLLITLAALAFLTARAQRRQLRWRLVPTAALLFAIALALGAQVSCGGGSGSSGGGGGGGGGQSATAPGTYTVSVNGTSGAMQASTNVTLVVQ